MIVAAGFLPAVPVGGVQVGNLYLRVAVIVAAVFYLRCLWVVYREETCTYGLR